MPSYILLNHKGWFCFQHLFKIFIQTSHSGCWPTRTTSRRFDIYDHVTVRDTKGTELKESIPGEGSTAFGEDTFPPQLKLGTKILEWTEALKLVGSPRHPSGITFGLYLIIYLASVCCTCSDFVVYCNN